MCQPQPGAHHTAAGVRRAAQHGPPGTPTPRDAHGSPLRVGRPRYATYTIFMFCISTCSIVHSHARIHTCSARCPTRRPGDPDPSRCSWGPFSSRATQVCCIYIICMVCISTCSIINVHARIHTCSARCPTRRPGDPDPSRCSWGPSSSRATPVCYIFIYI
jgi:hypothetical protein